MTPAKWSTEKVIDQNKAHELFWRSPSATRTLRDAIHVLMQLTRIDTREFAQEAAALELPGYPVPLEHTCIRFTTGSTAKPRAARQITGLLLAACSMVENFLVTDNGGAHRLKFKELFQLRDRANEKFGVAAAKLSPDVSGTARLPTGFTELWAAAVSTTQLSLKDAVDFFFPADFLRDQKVQTDRRYFDLYWHAGREGMIAKSLLALARPSNSPQPICTFTNFTRNDMFASKPGGEVAQTRGFVISSPRILYLIGQLGEGAGVEVIAIERPLLPRSSFNGLLLSFDAGHNMIAGRFIMRLSKHVHQNDARMGIYPAAELKPELGDDLDKLQNNPVPGGSIPMWQALESIIAG